MPRSLVVPRAPRALGLLLALSVLGGERALAQSTPAKPAPFFEEVGAARGLPQKLFCGRAVFSDVDGDGWHDLVLNASLVYRNVHRAGGGRRFEPLPGNLGLPQGKARPRLLLLADLDGDGRQDAFVGHGGDPGAKRFKPHPRRSRIHLQRAGKLAPQPKPLRPLLENLIAGAWLDYDRDGHLDLITGASYRSGGKSGLECFPVHLYRGLGGGRFQEVTQEAGLSLRAQPGHVDSRRPIFGVSVADMNNDGWQDLLLCAYGRQRNLLYLNTGKGSFREVGLASAFAGDADTSGTYPARTKAYFRQRYKIERRDEKPFRANGNTFDAPTADFDNDGDLDVFLGEITHAWAGKSSDRSSLLVNRFRPGSPLRFLRRPEVGARVHKVPNWNQGDLFCGWLDFDNDGWQDLLIASGEYPDGPQQLRLFRQHPPGRFQDVTPQAFAKPWTNCTALSLGDYDRDGDVDILVGSSNNRLPKARRRTLRPALFENRVGNRNHWLAVRLIGKGGPGGSNREALGARIEVQIGARRYLRELKGGLGHAGHRDANEAHFGLGRQPHHSARGPRIDRLVIRWPNKAGSTSVFTQVPANRYLVIREEGSRLQVLGPH